MPYPYLIVIMGVILEQSTVLEGIICLAQCIAEHFLQVEFSTWDFRRGGPFLEKSVTTASCHKPPFCD